MKKSLEIENKNASCKKVRKMQMIQILQFMSSGKFFCKPNLKFLTLPIILLTTAVIRYSFNSFHRFVISQCKR